MSDKEKCGNCKFFDQAAEDPNYGLCRRSPPVMMWVPAQSGVDANGQPQLTGKVIGSSYPPTQYKLWCGEWQQGNTVKGITKLPKTLDFPGGGQN